MNGRTCTQCTLPSMQNRLFFFLFCCITHEGHNFRHCPTEPKFHYIYLVGDLSCLRQVLSRKFVRDMSLTCWRPGHRLLILSSESDLIYLTIRLWLDPVCSIMVDDDDDEIAICSAVLTTFAYVCKIQHSVWVKCYLRERQQYGVLTLSGPVVSNG